MSERQEAAKSPWKRRFIILFIITVGIPALLVIWLVQRFGGDVPVDYDSPTEHFKYGSTGGEHEMGFPYWIWRVLPVVFADHLPNRAQGYAALGVYWEPGAPVPVGLRSSVWVRSTASPPIAHSAIRARIACAPKSPRIWPRPAPEPASIRKPTSAS